MANVFFVFAACSLLEARLANDHAESGMDVSPINISRESPHPGMSSNQVTVTKQLLMAAK